MRIQHNIMAMNAYRNYNTNTSALSKNLEKLSSGYKINRAGDDAAGLAISEKMRAQITGLNAAQKNVKDGISLVKTAEGAMQEIQDMLNRMDYLATQSANGTYDNEVDRLNLQKEVNQLRSEINRIADSANFNGIKLLDGTMDEGKVTTKDAASAISGVTTGTYVPKGQSDAFTSKFIIERPEAASKQTCSEFTVSLDDLGLKGFEANDEFKLNVGGTEITAKFAAGDGIAEIVGKLVAAGHAISSGVTEAQTNDTAANGNTTKDFTGDADWKDATKTGAYVEIDGHIWKMSKTTTSNTDDSIKFTQVDFNTDTENRLTPDYSVTFSPNDTTATAGSATAEITGTVNRRVQQPTTGIAVGSSQQAQVDVNIDFTKLKDGDTLTAGNRTYIFAIGKDSAYKTNVPAGTTKIDLTSIFKEESDLTNEGKQAQAMVAITTGMKAQAATDPWTVGNQGVSGNVGTLTFQSQSTYDDDTDDTAAATTANSIGGLVANGKCDMTTEANVMKQFYTGRQEAGANLSFNVDVTKIKAGDTFTIDGKVFEFTDGPDASSKSNLAIDLSSLGISGGILKSQTATVMEAIKTQVNTIMHDDGTTAKYSVKVDGDKITLTSMDTTSTPNVFENRNVPELKLPTVSTTGKALVLQIGDTSESYNQLKVSVGDMHTKALGIDELDISKPESAKDAIQTIKNAINYVSGIRGDLGATQNRLEHTANNLSVMAENIQDAESTIRDTDVAEEMMAYTKNNILIQSAQAMLAQANAVPQGVLQLLG